MENVIKHGERITQIKSPLPFPLRWVNSYLIRGSNGYTLIDPGLHTEEAVDHWLLVLEKERIYFKDIEKIVLTHHHPDHYGLAGWFQNKTSAPVYMSELSFKHAVRMWGEGRSINQELNGLYVKHGMDSEIADRITTHMESFVSMVSPQPKVEFIKPQENIVMGDQAYLMISAPGHALGQLLFYDAEHKEIFCGDQVIPRISPNVSYLPWFDLNPLASFMDSLEEISKYPVIMAYPGHRDPFHAFTQRAEEIISHHHKRLQEIVDLLKKPLTAYELCQCLFGNKLSLHQLQFAVSETLAHTKYLLQQGKAVENDQGGTIVYQIN